MLDSYSFENYQKIVEYEIQEMRVENQKLRAENQKLRAENQKLHNKLNQTILSMIQIALEYGADEMSAIRKTAEKCKVEDEFVTELWNAYKEGR